MNSKYSTLAVFLLILCAINCSVNANLHPVTIIAHMVNTPTSVRWALEQGANGIELDLKFYESQPSVFHHGPICDCSCLSQWFIDEDNMCRALDEGCNGITIATDMTNFLGSEEIITSNLSLIYIDSKVDNSVEDYAEAGANVVRLFNKNVMARGYRGQIIIGCPSFKFFEFIQGAFEEANKSVFANRYFYTIDQVGAEGEEVWEYLRHLGTRNIVFSMGITSCLFIDNSFYKLIENSLKTDIYAAVGVWTVDSEMSIDSFLKLGVDFILTNNPSLGVDVVSHFSHYQLAPPGKALPLRSNNQSVLTTRQFRP